MPPRVPRKFPAAVARSASPRRLLASLAALLPSSTGPRSVLHGMTSVKYCLPTAAPTTAAPAAPQACGAAAPSDVPSNSALRFVVNGTATERLAVLEGGRVAVRLELQVQRQCDGEDLRVPGSAVYDFLALRCICVRCRNRGLHGMGSRRYSAVVRLLDGLLVSLAAGSVRVGCGHCPLQVVQQHTPAARVRIADSDHRDPKSISVV